MTRSKPKTRSTTRTTKHWPGEMYTQMTWNGRQHLITGSYAFRPDIKVRLDEIREVTTWEGRDVPLRKGFVYRPNFKSSIATRGAIPNLDEAERVLREAALRVLMAHQGAPIRVRGRVWRDAIAASLVGALTLAVGAAATPQARVHVAGWMIWAGDQIIEKIWVKEPVLATNSQPKANGEHAAQTGGNF